LLASTPAVSPPVMVPPSSSILALGRSGCCADLAVAAEPLLWSTLLRRSTGPLGPPLMLAVVLRGGRPYADGSLSSAVSDPDAASILLRCLP